MKNDIIRNGILILIWFIVLWYGGAMFSFFPFSSNDIAVGAIGFTGLLICVAVVVCACWIISEIKKKS